MDIAGIISELLEHQAELAVPGLGTFYRNRLDGHYSKEHQQFFPPSLQLKFNPDVQHDDGKLIAGITANRHITISEANYQLEKFVTDVLQRAHDESVSFADLGAFSVRRGQLLFMPKKLNNNNEVFYGLAPVKFRLTGVEERGAAPKKTLIQVPHTEKTSEFTAALLRGEPMPGKSLSSVNGEHEPEIDEETGEIKKAPLFSNWVLILAIIITVSGVGLIGAYKLYPHLFDRFRGQMDPPPVINVDKRRSKEVSDSIQRAIQAQKDIGVAPAVDSATQSKILAPETPVDTFAVIIARFATMDGAKKEYDRLSYKNLPVEVHKNPLYSPNPYQLTVALDLNVDSAKRHRDEYRVKLHLPTVYIQKYPYKKQ
jgi:hypothetical protein